MELAAARLGHAFFEWHMRRMLLRLEPTSDDVPHPRVLLPEAPGGDPARRVPIDETHALLNARTLLEPHLVVLPLIRGRRRSGRPRRRGRWWRRHRALAAATLKDLVAERGQPGAGRRRVAKRRLV